MYQSKLRKAIALATLSASIAMIPQTSVAAEQELEEVVVTGSFIKGTPEDAALPVDVLSREDLEEVGNPSLIEMVRNLGVASGNLGETNQFDTRGGQGNEGVSTINLRGLGSSRTLVLLNSKRHVATESVGVDISALPSTAIGRVEILKDGAAALYGSDAIAGVVNFITRDNFEGLELRGSYQDIQNSDGDQQVAFIFGRQMDNVHFAISGEYEQRGELAIRDRDWALPLVTENSQAGFSSIGNPGTIFPTIGTTTIAGGTPDANCEALGAQIFAGFCRFQFTYFDNLIEEQENTKLFGELNIDLTDNVRFHMEALYADVDIPEWDTSPSYPPQSLLGADRVIQPNHPGLVDYKAQNPTAFSDIDLTAAGIGIIPAAAQGAKVWSRMIGVSGRNGLPESASRVTETKRLSGGFDGAFDNGVDFDVSLSWSKRDRQLGGSDMFIERMALSLDGLGGPNCDSAAAFAAGTAGTGSCEYYNPLSNALPFGLNGVTNPQYNPAVANSDALINWMTADTGSQAINELLVFDAVFTGETQWALDGGNVGWAAGFQSRSEDYDFTLKDVANRAINPCPFTLQVSVDLGHVADLNCGTGGAGLLAFLAASDEESTSRTIFAAFGELALPISDDLNVQLAARFEDYEDVGSTFDPKIAVSWNVSELVKVRGSASTTFRGPPASFLAGTGTALEFVGSPVLAFKARDTFGNANLQPETAVALNFGIIVANDNFYGSVDYWSFDFEDSFQTESGGQILGAYLGNDCADGGAGVGTNACNVLRPRVLPLGAGPTTLERIGVNIINGADIKTSGVDLVANYTFDDVGGGSLTLGFEGTYALEYEADDFTTIDGFTLRPGGDFIGKLNDGTPFLPKPEFKATYSAKWGNEAHRVTYQGLYVDSYVDDIPANARLATIDSHLTHDIHYINNMFDQWTLSLSVVNATDEDPPAASLDLNYDGYTHNAFGRMIKLGVVFTPELF
jgi:iron complex outermembrane receptor protein